MISVWEGLMMADYTLSKRDKDVADSETLNSRKNVRFDILTY